MVCCSCTCWFSRNFENPSHGGKDETFTSNPWWSTLRRFFKTRQEFSIHNSDAMYFCCPLYQLFDERLYTRCLWGAKRAGTKGTVFITPLINIWVFPQMVVPQNTPKWSFLVGKPMVVGYHHFRKPPHGLNLGNYTTAIQFFYGFYWAIQVHLNSHEQLWKHIDILNVSGGTFWGVHIVDERNPAPVER